MSEFPPMGQVRRCRPRPPTVRFASIAGILLRCREPPVGAICGLSHRSRTHQNPIRTPSLDTRNRCSLFESYQRGTPKSRLY
jgi:hypothetical protein